MEVVIKTRREERGSEENFMEVSSNGRRGYLEAEERPLELMQAWPYSRWRFKGERNMEEETRLWWRKCSNFGTGGNTGHYEG